MAATYQITYWFTCSKCGAMLQVNEEQANGHIAIKCNLRDCNFYASGYVRPLISTTQAYRKNEVPSRLLD